MVCVLLESGDTEAEVTQELQDGCGALQPGLDSVLPRKADRMYSNLLPPGSPLIS